MNPGLSDEEFVGYLFGGSPERRPRLWFLDRHIALLMGLSTWTNVDLDRDMGSWLADIDYVAEENGVLYPVGHLRYRHHGDPAWNAVWRLTTTTIPADPAQAALGYGITTFGRDDDVWRLGVWPD